MTVYTDSRIAAHLFQPERLTLARELRGFSKVEIAEKICKSVSSISQFEAGKIKPEAGTIAEISLALALPVGFFCVPLRSKLISVESCHFRSLRSAKQSDRRELLAHATILADVFAYIDEHVELPADRITPFAAVMKSDEEIEKFAVGIRKLWGLGLGPIDNLTRLIESNGAVVSIVSKRFAGIDAFSTRCGSREFIFLVAETCTSRLRFDLAHELGHLLMHQDAQPGDRHLEDQANRFAGAFLLPRESFGLECPRRIDLDLFFSLKLRWGVSVAAMVRRARDLGRITEAGYRRAFMQLSRSGERLNERNEPEGERPSIMRKALKAVSEHLPLQEVANAVGVGGVHLSEILRFNCADIQDCPSSITGPESKPVPLNRLRATEHSESVGGPKAGLLKDSF